MQILANARPDSGADPLTIPGDEAQKRAIARAVRTEIHWLMPKDRTVTVAVRGDDIAVELGPALDAAAIRGEVRS